MAKNKYANYTHAQLVEELKKLSKRKKYGLVWEEEKTKEKFEAEAEGKLPVLTEDKKREIKTDENKPTNILIEGDNYHSLSVLNYTHAKSIDVIYIDPPYNTGARNWKYNNDFVDNEDAYRHSKFINFLNNRFKLAQKLLSDKGIIICAIDDYEIQNVRHLMDSLFGEENRLSSIVVVHNPRGRNDDKYFATMHEYMLVYAKNKKNIKIKHFALTDQEINKYDKKDNISFYNETSFIRTGNNSKRHERKNLFYPIYYNVELNELALIPHKASIELLPINEAGEEKTWRWGKDTFLKKKQTELLVRKVKDRYRIFKKRRITNIEGTKPKTIWHDSKYDASSNGIMLLQKILGREKNFPYPKSLYTVLDILKLTTDKDSVVLDYFAGSGTTGHAILELNRIDKGKRQFIICTNNENDICNDITYPRINNVINGYKFKGKEKELIFEKKITPTLIKNCDDFIQEIDKVVDENKSSFDKLEKNIDSNYFKIYGVRDVKDSVKGLGGNLKYYKTNFVGSEPTHRNKKLLTEKSIEMLCIRENTFEEVLSKPDISIFKSKTKYTGILFNEMKMEEFKREINKLKLKVSVYVFSLEGDDFSEDFQDIKNDITLCSIPEAILKVYRRIYETANRKSRR